MRAQADGIDLLGALVVDPSVDQVVGEHIALQEKVPVLIQGIQRLFQRPGRLRHPFLLLGRQIVQVFVQRVSRVDLPLNAV